MSGFFPHVCPTPNSCLSLRPLSVWQNRWNIVMVYLCPVISPPFLPVRAGLCNRLQRLPPSLSSFSITLCSCAGHQMTSSPPEELSSFFISAAAWLSLGQQPATQGEGTSACLRIRDRLPYFPSVSPSDWTPHVTAPLPPCYSRENAAIWYMALFVPCWAEWQTGLRLMHYMHDLQQKTLLFGKSCLQHKSLCAHYHNKIVWNCMKVKLVIIYPQIQVILMHCYYYKLSSCSIWQILFSLM